MDEFVFENKRHAEMILTQLNNFRENEEIYDIILETNNVKIFAHKNILAACSPYFKTMFSNADNSKYVLLNDIDSKALYLLINYLYTGSINITKSNCQSLIPVCSTLEIFTIRQAACEFLEKQFDYINCIEVYFFAKVHGCIDLQEKAFNHAVKNFFIASRYEIFLNLGMDKLIEMLKRDDLQTINEIDVFLAVQRWYEHKPEDRYCDLYKVLKAVRLALIDYDFLNNSLDSFTALKTSPNCAELIKDAQLFHTDSDKSTQVFNYQTKPRNNVDILQIILVIDGETIKGFCPISKKWYCFNDLPVALKAGGVVSKKNNLFVIGNIMKKNKLLNRIWKYESSKNLWEEITSFFTARSNFGLTTLQQYMYVVAGRDSERKCLNSVERYDLENKVWSFVSNMENCSANVAVISHDGMLYVAGGINEGIIVTNSFQQYNPEKNTWTKLSPLLVSRFGSAICTMNNYIYVIGGCTSLTNTSSRMERYDVKANCWKLMSSMNERRFEPGIAVMYNKIYVFGGRNQSDNNKYHDTVECYDPDTDNWKVITKLPSKSLWLNCVPFKIKKFLCIEIQNTEKIN